MFLFFILCLNILICWSNCRVTGKMWDETKGKLSHVVTISGFLQGVLGFSWCFLFIEGWVYQHVFPTGFGEHHKYILTPHTFLILLKLGYLVLVPGLLLTGLVIWINSLVVAWKTKRISDIAVAGWNSYAQVSNMIGFARDAKPFLDDVMDFFKKGGSDDEDGGGAVLLVIVLAAAAILGGIITGTLIMTSARASERRAHALELRAAVGR